MKTKPFSRLFSQLPNLLTLFRIVLIPIFAIVMYLPFSYAEGVAASIFLIAAVTDWLDGFLARRWQQTSSFGAFLDPVADKLMVAVALVILVQKLPFVWMALSAAVIIGREITISALREWMAEYGKRVSVSFMGKIKTVLQMAAIFCLIYESEIICLGDKKPHCVTAYTIGQILMLIAVALTLWSMFLYLKVAWQTMADKTES